MYAGISSYSADATRDAATIARELGTPLLIHQPSYSMLNRWIEGGLLDELEEQALVERKRDPDDRRRQLVRITADGKRVLAKLRALSKRLEDEFLAPLDAEQREQLHTLLLVLAGRHEPRCAPPLVDG